MEIFLTLEPTATGYLARSEQLPGFQLWGQSRLDIFNALPTSLKTYVTNWSHTTDASSANYTAEIPFIQRLKARGYYQSTAHRLLELDTQREIEAVDLELIHCLQRKAFQEFLTVA